LNVVVVVEMTGRHSGTSGIAEEDDTALWVVVVVVKMTGRHSGTSGIAEEDEIVTGGNRQSLGCLGLKNVLFLGVKI
jgi:hypothetical protein